MTVAVQREREREKREGNEQKYLSFSPAISIMPLNFDENYKLIPGVIFVFVFLCLFIIADAIK